MCKVIYTLLSLYHTNGIHESQIKPMTKQETNQRYYEYLQSEEWKAKAKQRLEIDGYVCQGCGAKGSSLNVLQVHHLTYHNVYNENVYTDLVTVCRSCHAILHNALNRTTSQEGMKGFKQNPNVPSINTFTLSGADLRIRKGNLEQC